MKAAVVTAPPPPYTISFEEASRNCRHRSGTFAQFPAESPPFANELGRPDDGTDSTGFFNNEFYIGLKSYDDKAWQGSIHNKKELIDAIQQKTSAFSNT